MEKKEFQKFVKEKMKAMGFKSSGNSIYKILSDDYLIGLYLDHHSFCRGYRIECGALYLPDSDRWPIHGGLEFDWQCYFKFPPKPGDDIWKCFERDDGYMNRENLIEYFEYDIRTKEELEILLNANIEKYLLPLYDKRYPIEYYERSNRRLVTKWWYIVDKILPMGNFDKDKIYNFKKRLGSGARITQEEWDRLDQKQEENGE